jgi:hypothetical protein
MRQTFRASLLRALPSAASSGVMPRVSLASQARFPFSHISSRVQAGSSFSSRVITCWLVMCIVTRTQPASGSCRTTRKSGACVPASKGTTRFLV